MENNKTLRGILLLILHRVYPAPMIELDIIGMLYPDFRDSQIKENLCYLVDKGYLVLEKSPHPLKKRIFINKYRLSAEGLDLINGDIDDNCVLVPEE